MLKSIEYKNYNEYIYQRLSGFRINNRKSVSSLNISKNLFLAFASELHHELPPYLFWARLMKISISFRSFGIFEQSCWQELKNFSPLDRTQSRQSLEFPFSRAFHLNSVEVFRLLSLNSFCSEINCNSMNLMYLNLMGKSAIKFFNYVLVFYLYLLLRNIW